jgi:atypical protein kinase C zeta type
MLTRTKDIIILYNITAVVVFSFLSLISLGGIGAIYKLNVCIIVKIPCYKDEPDYTTKQSIFNILESYLLYLNLVTSFLRVLNTTFLEFLLGGNLILRL